MDRNPEIEVRPRSLGEIFDDAWRLYLAHLPLFLLVTGMALVPCAVLLLVLVTQVWPAGAWQTWLLTVGLALLLPWTGLGSAVCQEIFHCWGERRPVTLRQAVRVARRRWLNHVTAQALMMLVPLAALLLFFSTLAPWGFVVMMLVLPLWGMTLAWQAVITGGQKHLGKGFRYSRRCAGRHPGKAVAIVGSRLLVLFVALLNLHLFAGLFVWIGDQLAGFDVGVLYLVLSLDNPVWLLALGMLTWWLLAPYNEAVNYLFYMDARTRYEGVDLWYRIEQNFPIRQISKAGAILLILGASVCHAFAAPFSRSLDQFPALAAKACHPRSLTPILFAGAKAQAPGKLQTVQNARQQVAKFKTEAETVQPYPGGKKWQRQMVRLGNQLDPDSDAQQGRYQWFFQAVEKLGAGDRKSDVQILGEIENKLLVIEKSLTPPASPAVEEPALSAKDIRQLVPPYFEQDKIHETEKKKKEEKPIEKDNELRDFGKGPAGPGIAPPVLVGAGAGQALLYFLIALMVMVLLAGLALALVNWLRNRPPKKLVQQGQLQAHAEEYLENPDQQNVRSLWQRADDLACAGRHLEALRTLYLGVLALLHQTHLIRYERTRTNGEYADQLRRQVHLHPLFLHLTGIFELKWYGERACGPQDYTTCREMASRLEPQAKLTETQR